MIKVMDTGLISIRFSSLHFI